MLAVEVLNIWRVRLGKKNYTAYGISCCKLFCDSVAQFLFSEQLLESTRRILIFGKDWRRIKLQTTVLVLLVRSKGDKDGSAIRR